MSEKIKVHYIGQGVYSAEKFTKEAKKLGVSRPLPIQFIKTLNFRDKIYLAQWNAEYKATFSDPESPKYNITRTFGTAKIFGYFFIEGINLPSEVSDYVADSVGASDPVEVSSPNVDRECGSYIIVSVRYTSASLAEIAEAVEEAKEIQGMIGDEVKVKCFITGKFIELEEPIIRKDELFCRTIREMPMDLDDGSVSTESKMQIQGIKDYEQRTYIPKGEKVVGSQ